MKNRLNQGARPQITFTSDFHELVAGDLIPGPCVLRYDPLRLISAETHSQDHHVRAFVRFHPNGGTWEGLMTVPAGVPLNLLADPAAQGYMLETAFVIPPGCQELEVWFSCTHADSHTHWDSKFGQNYWLRFPLHDLSSISAKVKGLKKATTGQDFLEIQAVSLAEVEQVEVRWRLTNPPGYPRKETSLLATTTKDGTSKLWSTPPNGIPVPKGATVVFDIVYYVSSRKFTDDNQGRWYLAD